MKSHAESIYDFEETYDRLLEHFRNNDNISVFAKIDHGYNARQIGQDLAFAKLVVFGNPKAGIPLIQEKQLSSLALPLKS